MPFIQSQNLVVEKEVLSEITQNEINSKPKFSSLIMLQGGQGGFFGEKSYKPKVILGDADIKSSELSLSSAAVTIYSTTEIKNENDCGYAIDFKTDASNKCSFTIGQYNPNFDLNIYTKSLTLPFSDVFTGGVNNATDLYNNDNVGNFKFVASTAGVGYSLTPQLDSELNLNKYYLDLRNSDPVEIDKPFYLEKSINFADVGASVYVFYVAEIDLVSGYATYSTGTISYNKEDTTTSITGGFFDNIFQVGDIINISHPNNYYQLKAEITNKDVSNIYTLSIEEQINPPSSSKTVVFPVGSSVTILDDDLNANKLSVWTDKSLNTLTDYNNLFLDPSYGTQINIGKKVTSNHKETFNKIYFNTEKKFLSAEQTPFTIAASYNRIGNRTYMQDQYGTDIVKNQIKNKAKFGIFYHGIEKTSLQPASNSNQSKTIYNCGCEGASFVSNAQLNQDVFSLIGDKTIKLILGTPLKYVNNVARCYYSNKIYEVLVYVDLKSSDIPKIISYLSNKYSQKMVFSSPVEFQSSDMYYSIADKINILGKVKKTSS